MGLRKLFVSGSTLALLACGSTTSQAPQTVVQSHTEGPAPAITVVEEVDEVAATDPDAAPCEGKVFQRKSNVLVSGDERTELATVEEININGDDQLELFVKGSCETGSGCAYQVFAACGGDRYAQLPASGLVGDGLRTSNKGALHDRTYWRDLILVQFHTKGIKMWESGTRYRFDGHMYQKHSEL